MRPTSLPSVILGLLRTILMILGFVLFVALSVATIRKVATPAAVHHRIAQPELQVMSKLRQ